MALCNSTVCTKCSLVHYCVIYCSPTSVSCLSTCSQLASEKSSVLQRDRQLGSRLKSESVIEV